VYDRATLKLDPNFVPGLSVAPAAPAKKKGLPGLVFAVIAKLAVFNMPLAMGPLGKRMSKDLGMAKIPMSPEEFLLVKEVLIVVAIWVAFIVSHGASEILMFGILMGVAIGYYLPEFWLKTRLKRVKEALVHELPDTVDLLGLCVNAGLDFMMALKYVVEKSSPSVMIEELKSMMQEINVGKPRRDALRDMARKYELPDLSTFARTLIQADRMGTSVTDALNILSEDMREARFRRGEIMAMKAPLKMLIPLLFFIFPVVAILVAGPVFLDFFQNNPLQTLGK